MILIDVKVIEDTRRVVGLDNFVLLDCDEAVSRENDGEKKENTWPEH